MSKGRWLQSVQARVLAATVAGVALALVLTGWGLLHLFRQHAERQFQAELTLQLHQVLARLQFDPAGQPVLDSRSLSDPRWTQPLGGLYWQISQPDGTVVQRSRSLWDQVLNLPADVPSTGELHRYQRTGPAGQPLLVLEQSVVPAEADTGTPRWTVAVAAHTGPLEEAVRAFTGAVVLTLLVLLGVLTAAAVAQVWLGLAPLRAVQHSLDRLNAGHSQRLEGPWPSEVHPLAEGFNQALDRLDHHLNTARTQAGNLAHALKTPLAILRQGAEAAEKAAQHPVATPGSETHGLPQLVLDQVGVAQQQVDRHLRRARSAALAGHRGTAGLVPVLHGLLRVMGKVHAQRQLALTLTLPEGASTPNGAANEWPVAVDNQDLHDMLGNVLDNACRWAETQVQVRVQCVAGSPGMPPGLAVTVEDDGPGIAPEHLSRVLQRGHRLDEQVPGSGLGLAIVDELAQLHGATLSVCSGRHTTPAGSGCCSHTPVLPGLSVRLHLPVAVPGLPVAQP